VDRKAVHRRGLGSQPANSSTAADCDAAVCWLADRPLFRGSCALEKLGGIKDELTGNADRFFPGPLLDADLDPLFWIPKRLGVISYWWGHVPFAHWLATSLRPQVMVELGTFSGVSFSAFCEAMRRQNIPGRCYAIDTWSDEEQYGMRDDSTFIELRDFCRTEFGDFAELVRSTFKDALPNFGNGSIDLLHIDAPHSYDSVKEEFDSWLPKLSERAVVLLHDTNIREAGFGVWRFWDEFKGKYPSFEFLHANGLGILGVGRLVPKVITDLQSLASGEICRIRERSALLGARWEALNQATRSPVA
jgi:hypothetical protein